MTESHRLVLPDWYDDRAEWEHASKGFLPGAFVQFDDGARYPVFFYDPVRLGQDLEGEGKGFIAEVGLIVVPEVTRDSMLTAVARLAEEGYFRSLKPLPAKVAIPDATPGKRKSAIV